MSICKTIFFLGLFVTPSIVNAACPRFQAPSQFDNPSSWGNDSGPVVTGFIDSKRPSGGLFGLIHGVDLDSYFAVDHSQIVDCGGKFAIVRINQHSKNQDTLDKLFAANMAGLAKVNVGALPYYFFALPDDLKLISKFNNKLSASDEAQYRKTYENVGAAAGQRFLDLLASAKYDVPVNELSGLKGQFASVDVEENPTDVAKANSTAKKYYGTFYGAAVCSWIKTVTGKLPQLLPVLYTMPSVYGDYLQYAEPDVNACLAGLPVWVARVYGNGWEAIRETDPTHCANSPMCVTDRLVQLLCEIQSGNRCIIQQYTQRGIAIAIGATLATGAKSPHIDMDRFYTSKVVATNAGTQFVRVEDAFKP